MIFQAAEHFPLVPALSFIQCVKYGNTYTLYMYIYRQKLFSSTPEGGFYMYIQIVLPRILQY